MTNQPFANQPACTAGLPRPVAEILHIVNIMRRAIVGYIFGRPYPSR
jgi:hypothetical protein